MAILQQTAERHESALADAYQAGIDGWWPAADRLSWSAGLLRIYGPARAPSAEEGFTRLVHPDDRIRVETETAAYLGSMAGSFRHGFRIVRPDGEVRFILDRGTIEREANGVVVVIRGLNVDLTNFAHLDRASMAGRAQMLQSASCLS